MISHKLALLLLFVSYTYAEDKICDEDKDCQPGESCVGPGRMGRFITGYPFERKYCRNTKKCLTDEQCDEGEKCIQIKVGFAYERRCEKDESEEPEEPKETMEVKERKPCGDGSSCDWDEECATGCVHWPPRPTWPPPPCCKKIFPPPTEETTKEQEQPTKKCYKNSDCPQGTECRGAEDCSHACSIGWGCIPIACFPHQG